MKPKASPALLHTRHATGSRMRLLFYWALLPATALYMHGRSRAKVIMACGDHVLLVQDRISDGKWTLPGGGVKRREAPAAAAAREVQEELHIALAPHRLQPLGEVAYTRLGISQSILVYAAKLSAARVPTYQKRELSAARWMPIGHLGPANTSPETLAALALAHKQ